MNKIVRKSYPVERLPADLQSGLPPHGHVDIEMELAVTAKEPRRIADLVASGQNVHGDLKTVLGHLRGLREDR
jgi:hypothetical protein